MGLLNRLPRAAKACPKCDTRADNRPGAALPAVLLREFTGTGAILQQETRQHGLVKAARNRSSIAAKQDSILTGGAPKQRRHRMRFNLSLQDRTFLHVRARTKLCAPIGTRAQRRSCKRLIERMRASDSRAGFAFGPVDLRRKTGAKAAFAMHAAPNGTIRKYLYTTKACVEILRRSACYLCNTHPKTG
jgi:hypothetical protein